VKTATIQVPSREIQYFKNAVRIIYHVPREKKRPDRYSGNNRKSNKVTEYSPKTARRLGLHLSEFGEIFTKEITLTYPKEFPCDGLIVRKNRELFLLGMKRKYPQVRYTTVLEFQERGAPHIHILSDQFVDKAWISDKWFRVVGSGDLNHKKCGTTINNIRDMTKTKTYMSSYAKKKDQKKIPAGYKDVGRMWTSNMYAVPHEIEDCEYSEVREMCRENRQITRWRKSVKRKIQKKTGKKFKKWKIVNGRGFTAWGPKNQMQDTLDKLKPCADDSVPF